MLLVTRGVFDKSYNLFRSVDSSDAENPGNNLYVTGLSARVTDRDLEKHFSTEGEVTFTENFCNFKLSFLRNSHIIVEQFPWLTDCAIGD
jgi:hypothetical protein